MSTSTWRYLIQPIHDSPSTGVLAVTGGGSGAISALLEQPGASRTVLEAVVPYSQASLEQWLAGPPASACSEATSRAMAMAAYQRARRLSGIREWTEDGQPPLFGLGCTASLASDRPKRGDHRVHVAVQTGEATRSWSLTLDKDARSREQEERIATDAILNALAEACGLEARFTPAKGDQLKYRELIAPQIWRDILWGDGNSALIDLAGDRREFTPHPRCERVLFPGAFSPPHEGHRRMLQVAQQRLGKRVTLELCVNNVDKPMLDYLEIDDRLRSMADLFGDAEVWLTRLPTFLEKATSLGPVTFVVGADTVCRIADPKYYGPPSKDGGGSPRDNAIAGLAERGARFLVFGRLVDDRFEALDDLKLPPSLRAICQGVPEAEFREDISSTQLRSGDSPPPHQR